MTNVPMSLACQVQRGHVIMFDKKPPIERTNLVTTYNPTFYSVSCQQEQELMASVQRVKIIARLRPPIPGELSDNGIRIIPTDDGLPAICVNNPRDHSQVFKFP
jgi:hypothetical protein